MKRAVLAVLMFSLVLPAAPAHAGCTQVGSIAFGTCNEPKKPPKKPTNQDAARRTEATILDRINDERARAGLRRLPRHAAALQVARRHAKRMADRGSIYHNPGLRSSSTQRELGYPAAIGENVGYGPSAGSLHRAFMNSKRHRANIMGRWDLAAVGAYYDGRNHWVTELFIRRGSGRPAQAAPVVRPKTIKRPKPAPLPDKPVVTATATPLATDSSPETVPPAAPGSPWVPMSAVLFLFAVPGALRTMVLRRRRGSRAQPAEA